MKTRCSLLVAFFLALSLSAQQPTPQPAEKPPEKCVLEGQVVRAGSGEPLKKARVVLRKAEGRDEPYSTLSDAAGRFVLTDLEPGRYRLYVGRNGYVRQEYGQRQPNSPGTILTLAPGQRLRDLVFKLIPAAVIAGRVYDEDGEPVPGARMEALQYRYNRQNRRELAPMRFATSNDRGEYRLFGLPPGRYYISATYSPGMTYMGLGYMSEGGRTTDEEGYAPTYYPGTNDPGRATAMEVRQGDEVGGVDILLLPARAVRVRGRIINTVTGKPVHDAMIHLFPRGAGVRVFSFESRATVDPAKGTFEIARVTPGSYTLFADWYDEDSQENYRARMPLEVGSSNVEGIELVIGRGVELAGTVRLETGLRPTGLGQTAPTGDTTKPEQREAPLDLDDLFVQLNTDDDFPFGGESGPVKADGSFQVKNLSPGEYKVEVWQRGGLPGDYYLKSARLAGDDVLEEGLAVSGPVRGALELTLSPAGGHIEGTVLTAEGQPFSGARVVLVPEERRRQRTDLFKSTTTDQYGRFTLRGITPGEYKLFAWEDIEPGAYQDAEFLRPYEEKGKEVRIREGDRLEVELALIPADGPRPE